jgi:hypothetical protein
VSPSVTRRPTFARSSSSVVRAGVALVRVSVVSRQPDRIERIVSWSFPVTAHTHPRTAPSGTASVNTFPSASTVPVAPFTKRA